MAVKPIGGNAVLPAGPVSLLTLLAQNLTNAALLAMDTRPTFGTLSVRSARANAGTAYFGDKNLTNPPLLTAFGFFDPGEAVGFSLYQLQMYADVIYFTGTPGDTLYFSAVQL